MLYTPLTKKAMIICFEAHKYQKDKSGLPYVFHPFHLAEQMNDETTTIIALLHDVVEDTDITFDDLKSAGFPEEVTDALRLLTHSPDVPYMDYIANIKNNKSAKEVKLADLRHNSDMSRYDTVTERDIERQKSIFRQ
jgi:(p)ppGpp synthase/HD superfamily hydrolase